MMLKSLEGKSKVPLQVLDHAHHIHPIFANFQQLSVELSRHVRLSRAMSPMSHLLSMKMSIYLLFMYAKLHFLPASMRHGIIPGSNQTFSGAPKCLKHNKGHILFIFFSLSLDYVRPTISKHAILKVSGGKIKTGREITAQLRTLTSCMRYAQSPVPPQPILQSKAPLKIWEHQTGPTPCYQISSKKKIWVVSLILIFLSHSWTDRSTDQENQSMNIHGLMNTNIYVLTMTKTRWKY